ncbi:MAG: protein-L-isoaspartate(D-aspartate) O-methyltransferase [Deferribacterales bacterium]|nr:protein-L-isoaspartate(D-aspartate) O-methyltransferase [Deferribacterales bacterium]
MIEKTPKWFIDKIISPACGGNEAVIRAFEAVPRRLFVDRALWEQAYDDKALPIGMGQTISQPSTVAHMLDLLEVKPTDCVLEIGAGSGFVTALLSVMAKNVYAVERLPMLFEKARSTVRSLGIRNAFFRSGDGGEGWSQYAPFDKIIASAGADTLPKAFIEQIKDGGVILLPLKNRLVRYCVKGGQLKEEIGVAVKFVDFVGS